MPVLHYAKVNVNSHIIEVYERRRSIEQIMSELYDRINDRIEFVHEESRTFYDEAGNLTEMSFAPETFNFSDIEKTDEVNRKYITGSIVRRRPISSEEFDPVTRKTRKVLYSENAVSIFFYFDVLQEVVTFCERQKFGHRQFVEAFQNLLNKTTDVGFEVILTQDPFSIRERMERAYKITRITATVIPPNMNEEALRELYDTRVKDMVEGNITKKTSIFESKSEKGIDPKAAMVKDTLETQEAYDTFARGYGKFSVEGFAADGSKFYFDSEEHSQYQTIISQGEKESKALFIDASHQGILILRARLTRELYKG